VDYITPGIKLFAPTTKSPVTIEKRTFGVSNGKGKAGVHGPSIKTTAGISLGAVHAQAAAPIACDTAATPQCIASAFNP